MRVRSAAPLLVVLLLAPVARGQFQALPAEQIKKLKAATVYIKTKAGPVEGSGSGFLVKIDGQTGFVATNDHVIAPPRTLGRVRSQLELVFASGTKDEWAVPGEVVGRDSERDLALVRFRTSKTLPDPMPLTPPEKDKLVETTPVYVCGFPFGDMLAAGNKNPEISISQGSVSSFRSNDRGELVTVQLAGPLNPGNSGGPVVMADGKLVGVAVRTLKGAGLGEAVPGEMVGQMLKGRVGGVRLIQTRAGAAERTAALVGQVADPFQKVKNPKGLVAPAGTGNAVPTDVGAVPGAIKLPMRMADPSDMLVFAAARLPAARQVWVQVEWQDAGGGTRRSPAEKVDIKTVAQIAEEEEKLAALLQKLFGGQGGDPGEEVTPNSPPPNNPPLARGPGMPGFPNLPRVGPPNVPRVPFPNLPQNSAPGGGGRPIPLAIGPVNADHYRPLDEVLADVEGHANDRRPVAVMLLGGPVDHAGCGDGPSLRARNPKTGQPIPQLDFVLHPELANRVTDGPLTRPTKLIAVSGFVRDGATHRAWRVFVVKKVQLVGTDGPPGPLYETAADPVDTVANKAGSPPFDRLPDEDRVIADPTPWGTNGKWARLSGVLGERQEVERPGFGEKWVRFRFRRPDGSPGKLSFYARYEFGVAVDNAATRLATDAGRPEAEITFQVGRNTDEVGVLACGVFHVRLLDPNSRELLWESAYPPTGRYPGDAVRDPNGRLGPPPDEAVNAPARPAVTAPPPPAATTPAATTPAAPKPAGTPPAAKAATPAPKVIVPASEPAAPSSTGLPVWLFVLGGVFALGLAIGVGVLVLFVMKKPPPPAKRRSRDRDLDDDDEDDYDDRPRKPSRRR